MGGFGGQQASAGTLDTNQMRQVANANLGATNAWIPRLAETAGETSWTETLRNAGRQFGLLQDPNLIYTQQADDLAKDVTAMGKWKVTGKGANRRWVNPATGERLTKEQFDALKGEREARVQQLRGGDALADFRNTFADQFAARDRFMGSMEGAVASTPEYQRAQDAFGRGISAQTVGQRAAALSRAQAAGMGQVADVRAREVGAGMLGDTLMGRAMDMARSQGMLTPEASRDAVQAARQGMAARGLATGGAGLAAELLNRDRYSRQRMFQDLGFAQGIQGQDLERQFGNVGNVLRADLANQQTQFGREQIISQNQQQANLANMQAANNMAQFNTTLAANTDLNNANFADSANRYNMGLLGTSAQMSDAERARSLGLQQDIYNFGLQTDPRMLLAGIGSPLANMTQPAMGLSQVNMAPMYSGQQFSSGNNALPGMLGTLGGAALGAAGVALAPATFGTSLLPAMAGGAAIGGGLGGMFNR